MLVDLSVALNEKTPIYPGDPKTKIKISAVLEKDGYHDHYVSVGTHVGTHIDAPSHMIAGGKNLDEIPIDHFTGRGVYIDARKDFNFVEIELMDIMEDDIVLFHTGMSDKYHQADYFDNYPFMSEEIANYLIIKKV